MISIRWRLTILLWLSIGLLFFAAGTGVFLVLKGLLIDRFDETLTTKARALITASEIDGGDFEIDLTVRNFAGFGKNGSDYFEIRRADGSQFLRSPSLTKSSDMNDGFAEVPPPSKGTGNIGKLGKDSGAKARYYTQFIYPKGDKKNRFQDLYLVVASPVEKLHADLALLATALGLGGLLALLLMAPLIRIGLGRGLAPVGRLADEINKINSDDLHKRLDEQSFPKELQPVAAGLNGWLSKLEQSFERERRFTSHAAHELRTPLTELRVMAELGAMSPDEATPELCSSMVEVSEELGNLLEKLALLARSESGNQPVNKQPINLTETVQAVIARLAHQAEASNITLKSKTENTMISGDPILWQTILHNLLSNAIIYSPEGSIVEINASKDSFSSKNPAPEMTAEDLEHIFESFWRKDAARSGYGHSGLGLSIVKAFTSLCGWTCHASVEGEHLVMNISFQK